MNCPLPRYWMCHMAIALLLMVAIYFLPHIWACALGGWFFYAGREFTQWESGIPFDWKGLFAPLAAVISAAILISLL